MMRYRVFLCVVMLVACWAVGCSRSDTAQSSDNTLVVAVESGPKTLDPRYATDATGMRLTHQLMYDTLLRVGEDLQMQPHLASSWTMPSPTRYRVTLRQGVTFHNGAPLNAHDVAYTFNTLKDPATKSPFAATYKIIQEIKVIDDYTVEFVLNEPKAAFPVDLSMSILSKTGDASLGSGPFQLVSQDAQQIVLKPYAKYWGGASTLDRMVFKIVKDDNTRVLKLLHGDIDLVINGIPRDQVRKFVDHEKLTVVETPGIAYQYLVLNCADQKLKNVQLRQALAYALNIPEIIEHRLKGHAVQAHGLFSSVNWYDHPKVRRYDYQPEHAVRLLDMAGYPDPDGEGPKSRLQLTMKTSNNPEVVGIARIIQAQLAAVGVELQLRSFEWGTYYDDISKGNFQLASMRWVGVTEPDFYYQLFHSSQVPPHGKNRGSYTNTIVDRLVEQGRVEQDRSKRKSIYAQVQGVVADELPYISLWHNNNISIVAKRVQGYQPHPNGGFYSLKQVSLRPSK